MDFYYQNAWRQKRIICVQKTEAEIFPDSENEHRLTGNECASTSSRAGVDFPRIATWTKWDLFTTGRQGVLFLKTNVAAS